MTGSEPILTPSPNGDTPFPLSGEIDVANADEMKRRLIEHSDGASGDVIVDCSELTFIDSTGLRALCEVHADLEPLHRTLYVRGASPHLHRLLEITGLTSLLEPSPDGHA